MQKVQEAHAFTGMQRDLSVSKHPIQFLYDAHNVRLTSRNGSDTLLSITNEKGTADTEITISGDYLGHCLLNNYLVVFSTSNTNTSDIGTDNGIDYITRIDLSSLEKIILYESDNNTKKRLTFRKNHPIETIGSYENESIQKVYWTDNLNPPRVINIVANSTTESKYNSNYFDFIPSLKLEEEISVLKIHGASGVFAPGVIQYAFTYYRKNGQESCVFYTTPLYYISHSTRGAAPDEKVSNAFKISIKGVDENFDYLRIYSIQRTSINSTPLCKRIQDIEIDSLGSITENGVTKKKCDYIDTGLSGSSVDPSELLFKGGESVRALTMESKDNTLFLGNLTLTRDSLQDENENDAIKNSVTLAQTIRHIRFDDSQKISDSYLYYHQLSAKNVAGTYDVPCAGFKRGDTYRFGVQFQHKSGKWSEPFWVGDEPINNYPKFGLSDGAITYNYLRLPCIQGRITQSMCNTLLGKGYLKVRGLVVFPTIYDRNVLCQGVVNSTVFTHKQRNTDKDLYAQPSWFFRPNLHGSFDDTNIDSDENYKYNDDIGVPPTDFSALASPKYMYERTGVVPYIPYTNRTVSGDNIYDPTYIRQVEIEGGFEAVNQFQVDNAFVTMHSPDIEFDTQFAHLDFSAVSAKICGKSVFDRTFSDINIQTETPSIKGEGFVHKQFNCESSFGIISGLFYDDFLVDDANGFEDYSKEAKSAKWLVYPWQSAGSINNDMIRPADKGTATAVLKKKILANLRFANTAYDITLNSISFVDNKFPQLYSSDEPTILRFGEDIYQGNIDTSLIPDKFDGKYFCCDDMKFGYYTPGNKSLNFYNSALPDDGRLWTVAAPSPKEVDNVSYTYQNNINHDIDALHEDTPFYSNKWFKTWTQSMTSTDNRGIYGWGTYFTSANQWLNINGDIGDDYTGLCVRQNSIRMKYKSTPHLVIPFDAGVDSASTTDSESRLMVVELFNPVNNDTKFGGTSPDALKENTWIPCGEPVRLDGTCETVTIDGVSTNVITFGFDWGDTYYQRYDCLKTYAYTPEDINQIVEIGSFMLETRINMDGRYDRNRGLLSNLNVSPQNFNLINQVYSQTNNFFSYKIMDASYYDTQVYPNQVTWTKEKSSGAETDAWTNLTLASTYDVDGTKGGIEKILLFKDQLLCFQNKGISNLLFNSRVQIPTSDDVPIEISNSYKMDGCRYISDGVGCSNRDLVCKTPTGVYFIDSIGKHLFSIGEGITDLSQNNNMTSVFAVSNWNKLLYDNINHDLYMVDNNKALCYSELLSQFTGFFDYGDIDLIESCDNHVFTMKGNRLYKMFEGDYYCDFFGHTYQAEGESEASYHRNNSPWNITFISNGLNENAVALDKVFTNLEFRANVEGEGTFDDNTGKFTPDVPFDYLETWNEYQHGVTKLGIKSGHSSMQHNTKGTDSSIKRKFRIWRCDIPRDNVPASKDTVTIETPHTTDSDLGITRYKRKPVDRMRNTWLHIKLQRDAVENGAVMPKTEIHDIVTTYFI